MCSACSVSVVVGVCVNFQTGSQVHKNNGRINFASNNNLKSTKKRNVLCFLDFRSVDSAGAVGENNSLI